MSNYPAAPQYGAPYTPNGYNFPPQTTHGTGISQYQYDARIQSSYGRAHAQSPSNGVKPNPQANVNSFRTNAQRLAPPGSRVNDAFSESANQSNPSAFPLQSHPPVPIPFDSSVFSRSPIQASTGPAAQISHRFPPAEISNIQISAARQNSPQENPETRVSAISDLEDGEVDDEEIDGLLNLSQTSKMEVLSSRPANEGENERHGLSVEVLGNRHGRSANEDSPQKPRDRPSAASQSLHITKPNGSSNTQEMSSTHPSMNTPISNLPTNGAVSGHILTDVQVSKRKREEAKQALLDLHSHGFTFTQIVNQGLNPALLRTLYAEAGIQITSPSPPQLPQSAAPGADSQTSVAQEKNHTALSDLTSNSPITTAAKDVEPLVTGSTTVAAPKKSASNNLLAKPSAPKATISKPLDRKEYIARMLAAKAGKPTVNTNLPVPPKASATMTPEVIGPPSTSSAATIPSVPAVTHMDPEPQQLAQGEILGAPPPSLKDDADAEAKRKAKTDLARQKIEALRLQQETRKVTNRVSTHQSPPTSSGVNIPAPVVAPITVPRPPVPSRQSSYFSPVNQKAPFNIPGLFMTAEPSHSVKPSGKEREQSSVSLAGALQKPSFDLEPSQQPPPTRTAAPASEPSTESKPEATSNTAQRKRQKAADFLDSPSTRIKRPLGQQENYSVIIDISDDEMADASEIDSEEVETLGNRVPASKKPQPIESAGGWQRPLQDLPPLSDIPSRKTLATITPVAAMPTQTKGLKTTEMEIELMNRKIAELEQRVNAKKTISRAQTPGPLDSTTASPPLDGMSKKDHDASNATSKSLISNRLSGPGRSRQASLDSIGKIDTADAEQKLHEVERAKAEAERSLVADVAQASDQERVLQKDPPLAAQNEVQVTLGTDGQSLERVQMREVEQEQLHDRLPARNRSEELSRLDQLSHLRDRDDRHRSEPEHFHSQDEEKSRLLNEQRRTRRSAIKSGLPVLDATVDKTKQKLESLKQEIEDLELEVKKGIEGRKALVEELERLSQPSATKQHTNEPDVLDIGQRVEESLTTGADQALRTARSPIEVSADSSSPEPQIQEVESISQASTKYRHDSAEIPSSPSQATDEQLSDEGQELEDDIMDISRSEIDEAEIPGYSPQPPVAEGQQTAGSVDDEESYEPPSDISGLQQHNLDLSTGHPTSDSAIVETNLPKVANDHLSTDKQGADPSPSDDDFAHNADGQSEERTSHRSTSLADASDSDDYEPPEPVPLASEPMVGARMTIDDPKLSPLSTVDVSSDITPVRPGPLQGLENNNTAKTVVPDARKEMMLPEFTPNTQYFTPYESPLKQFKSFRNHPEYLHEVLNGFRSLTYSHAVKSDIPICRYELDGVCNDASCESQHFKTIGLSDVIQRAQADIGFLTAADERILVDLGTLPQRSDITALDASAYTNGLRKLIQDIRNRKVKDVNEVASEITAYRRQFLGEFRILSL